MKKTIFKYLLLMIGTTATAFAGEEVMENNIKTGLYNAFPKTNMLYHKFVAKIERPFSVYKGLSVYDIMLGKIEKNRLMVLKNVYFNKEGILIKKNTELILKNILFKESKASEFKYFKVMQKNSELKTENSKLKTKSSKLEIESNNIENKLNSIKTKNKEKVALEDMLKKATENPINANLNDFLKKHDFSEVDTADSTIISLLIVGIIMITIIFEVIATKVYAKVKESGSQDEFDFFDEDDYGYNY